MRLATGDNKVQAVKPACAIDFLRADYVLIPGDSHTPHVALPFRHRAGILTWQADTGWQNRGHHIVIYFQDIRDYDVNSRGFSAGFAPHRPGGKILS